MEKKSFSKKLLLKRGRNLRMKLTGKGARTEELTQRRIWRKMSSAVI